MSHKKGKGNSSNGRDSNPQTRGIKRYGGETVRAGNILVRQVEAGTGEHNSNDLVLHFGLGSEPGPVDLEVIWLNGNTQFFNDVAVDQTLNVQ